MSSYFACDVEIRIICVCAFEHSAIILDKIKVNCGPPRRPFFRPHRRLMRVSNCVRRSRRLILDACSQASLHERCLPERARNQVFHQFHRILEYFRSALLAACHHRRGPVCSRLGHRYDRDLVHEMIHEIAHNANSILFLDHVHDMWVQAQRRAASVGSNVVPTLDRTITTNYDGRKR